jgi:hypothetical protein
MRAARIALLASLAPLLLPVLAFAQVAGEDPAAIPGFSLGGAPEFTGHAAKPKPVRGEHPPRHPFMAPNGRSNLHNDAYQTDSYPQAGPLGNGIETSSGFFSADCGSVTFDRQGRIVTVCVGLVRPTLALLDPDTFHVHAAMALPPRKPSTNPFQDFSGGGYFYLDNKSRAVIPTTSHHILVVAETPAPGFQLARNYDVSSAMASGDAIISVLPDWGGRYWFATRAGVVGVVDRHSGKVKTLDTGEPIGNSFAVGRHGVFIVTDKAMYRFDRGPDGGPKVTWRRVYPNIGIKKPGQTEKGSGTTPTLMTHHRVAITDNADPMAVVVYRRGRRHGGEQVCRQPVFRKGQGDTDQSLIAGLRSMVVENNYGYTGPASTNLGTTTTPGIERVDIDKDGHGCHVVWHSKVIAPSVVPKLSLGAGLVYTYTKSETGDSSDPWYFTALDFRTGHTVYKRFAGDGLGYNNNYAPVTFSPDQEGVAYVGALGGLIRFADSP